MPLWTYFAGSRVHPVPIEEPLLAAFNGLLKQEVERHERVFVFLRRVEELEQLEHGYRLYTSFIFLPPRHLLLVLFINALFVVTRLHPQLRLQQQIRQSRRPT